VVDVGELGIDLGGGGSDEGLDGDLVESIVVGVVEGVASRANWHAVFFYGRCHRCGLETILRKK